MASPELRWTRYEFGPFGVACDILEGPSIAVMLDPRTPTAGYLAQTYGGLVLTVSYGAEESFENWFQRATASGAETNATIIQGPRKVEFCSSHAERVVLKIIPPAGPFGQRLSGQTLEPVGGEYAQPFLLTIVGTSHRQTPLVAAFQRPVAGEAAYKGAEQHFFASFHCES